MRPTVSPLGSSTSRPASRAQKTRAGAELTPLTRDAWLEVTAECLLNWGVNAQDRWYIYGVRAPRSVALVTLVASVLAGALAGCSGGSDTKERAVPTPSPLSGEAAKPAATIIADARAALLAATSVRVTGELTSTSGKTANQQRLDLRVARGNGGLALAAGRVVTVTKLGTRTNKVSLELIRIGPRLYIKGDRAYYASIGPKAAAVSGSWLYLPIAKDQSAASLTDISALAAGFASPSTPTRQGVVKLGSQDAVVVHTSNGATLYVAADGTPNPLRLQRASAGAGPSGTLDFTGYDAGFSIKAPAGGIDITKVRG